MMKAIDQFQNSKLYSHLRGFIISQESLFKILNKLHSTVLHLTKGRIGHNLLGMPVITLITTGRSTGLPCSVLLTSPTQEGNSWLLVASKGGSIENPQWYKNIQANPQVEVILPRKNGKLGKTEAQKFIAREVPVEDYSHYWHLAIQKYRSYEEYQRRTTRKIPLIILEPLSSP